MKQWYMDKLIEWVYSSDMHDSETPSCLLTMSNGAVVCGHTSQHVSVS